MEYSEALLLTQPDTQDLMDRVREVLNQAPAQENPVQTVTHLKKLGIDPEVLPPILNQIKLQNRAEKKFGKTAHTQLFTPEGLEQATRLGIAHEHAQRFQKAHMTHVTDVGCGIGADAYAFSAAGLSVQAVDIDPATAALAHYNLREFPDSSADVADAATLDLSHAESLWFDPARRKIAHGFQKRLADPADWSPSLDIVFHWARLKPSGIKLSPAFDHALIPSGMEAQWISDQKDVVELVLWSKELARPGIERSALIFTPEGRHEMVGSADTSLIDAVDDETNLPEYLYEPDGAVIRSGLLGQLAGELEAKSISPQIAYLVSDLALQSPFATGYRILERLPAKIDHLKKELKRRNIGSVEIKKRGFDTDPAIFRKQLRLGGKKFATLIMTRVANQHCALLVERI